MTKGSGIQIDDGDFTRIHNTILEKLGLARFTASEYRCLMFLFRMTYGWQKKEDAISLTQWATGTGIDKEKRHNVLRVLQELVAKHVIYQKSNGNNHSATWGFNKNWTQWDASLFDETVISQDNSSVMPDDNSHKQTVISPDNRCVISQDNTSVISRDNNKRKKEKKEKKRAATPAHAACVLFREIMHRNPTAYQAGVIADTVTDLELWRQCVGGWNEAGHKPTNVKGMLDWYRAGGPPRYERPTKNELRQFNGVGPPTTASVPGPVKTLEIIAGRADVTSRRPMTKEEMARHKEREERDRQDANYQRQQNQLQQGRQM